MIVHLILDRWIHELQEQAVVVKVLARFTARARAAISSKVELTEFATIREAGILLAFILTLMRQHRHARRTSAVEDSSSGYPERHANARNNVTECFKSCFNTVEI